MPRKKKEPLKQLFICKDCGQVADAQGNCVEHGRKMKVCWFGNHDWVRLCEKSKMLKVVRTVLLPAFLVKHPEYKDCVYQ